MRFKSSILFVVLFTMCTKLYGQHKLSGHIEDNDKHENIKGVLIEIPNLKMSSTTDKYGHFQFPNLKSGHYLIEISCAGYHSQVKSIFINKDSSIKVVLEVCKNELNEVIVTGVSSATALRNSPLIVTTIDKNTLNQNSSSNLIDGLKNIPGVNQITTGAAISKPIIRGLGYNRVISLNNGIRQEGQQWGDEHGIEIDEYAVDRIEIIKGPGSLMYGSDGIAGVLNFLAPKAPPIGEVHSQLTNNYQSNNHLLVQSISNEGNLKGIQWQARITHKMAGNYQNAYDGQVYNSGFKEWDGNLMLGINRNWGYSHISFSTYNNTLNLVEGERDSLGQFVYTDAQGKVQTATAQDERGYKIGFPHQAIQHNRLSARNYFILKKGTLNVDLGFQNNKRKEFGDPTLPNDIDLYFDLNTINYNLRFNLNKVKGWETAFGIGGMQQSNTNKGLAFLIPDYQLLDAGAFVCTQKTFKKISFAAGLRFDNRMLKSNTLYVDSTGKSSSANDPNASLKFTALNQNFNGISGSVGLSYQANEQTTIKANISRGFRAPNMAELSSNGRHEGSFRYEIGKPNLKPEISHQIDIAYFYNSEHVTIECSPFVNFIQNYIYAEKLKTANGNDSFPDPKDPTPGYQFSSGNATLLGGEVYVDVHPHPLDWLHLGNSFAYVQATQSHQPDSLRYLPFIPAPKYRGEIKAQMKQLGKHISNLYIKCALDHYFKQDKVLSAYQTETSTPAYTLLSAGLGMNIQAYHSKDFFSLFISAENLTDIAYQNNLSRLKYAPINLATNRMGVYNMGRNISIKLLLNF